MNPLLIQIGNFKIYWYSVMILLGVLLGCYIVIKEAKKYNISKEKISDMLFYTVLFGIIGARLYYLYFGM